MLVGVHGQQGIEIGLVLYCAEFGNVGGPAFGVFLTQRVRGTDADQGGAELGGELRDGATDGDAAGAGAGAGQRVGGGVAQFRHGPGAVYEVVDRVLLGGLLAGEMPILAQFAAAAHMGHGHDTAGIHPAADDRHEAGAGLRRNTVRTITIYQHWLVVIVGRAFLFDDGERQFCFAVLGQRGCFGNDVVFDGLRGRAHAQVGQVMLVAGGNREPCAGGDPGVDAHGGAWRAGVGREIAAGNGTC